MGVQKEKAPVVAYVELFSVVRSKILWYKWITGNACFLRRRLPNSTGFPEFDKGRLTKVSLYEIISLAIDLAILILTALSYFNNRKS